MDRYDEAELALRRALKGSISEENLAALLGYVKESLRPDYQVFKNIGEAVAFRGFEAVTDTWTAEQRATAEQALRRVVKGETYDSVAKGLGYADRQAAYKAVTGVLMRRDREEQAAAAGTKAGEDFQRTFRETQAKPAISVEVDATITDKTDEAIAELSDELRRKHPVAMIADAQILRLTIMLRRLVLGHPEAERTSLLQIVRDVLAAADPKDGDDGAASVPVA